MIRLYENNMKLEILNFFTLLGKRLLVVRNRYVPTGVI
jgi:hypothetical protein